MTYFQRPALIYKRLIRAAFNRKLLGAMGEAELARWIAGVSSHSIRVGVAQDNFAAGESLPAIMQAYRWRDSHTVMRYGAKLAARSGASARLAKRFCEGVRAVRLLSISQIFGGGDLRA